MVTRANNSFSRRRFAARLNSGVRHPKGGTVGEDFPDRNAKPFRLRRVAPFPVTGEELSEKGEAETERHIAVLGAMLFQHVSDIEETLSALASEPEYRKRLGKTQAALFEAIDALGPEGRGFALELCNYAMLKLLEEILGTFAVGERAFPGGYCVEYSITSHLLRIATATNSGVKLSRVSSCSISSEKRDAGLAEAFPKWLAQYRQSRNRT